MTHEIIIPNGTYTPENLVDYLNNIVFTGALAQIVASYNTNTGKFNLSRTAIAPITFYFDLDFSCADKNPCSYTTHGEIDPKQLTAGWLMVFDNQNINGKIKSPYLLLIQAKDYMIFTGQGIFYL